MVPLASRTLLRRLLLRVSTKFISLDGISASLFSSVDMVETMKRN